MAELNNTIFTGSGSPTIKYKVSYSVLSDGGYSFTITSYMTSSSSTFNSSYALKATITCGSYSLNINVKNAGVTWSGTTQYTSSGVLYPGYSTSARSVTFAVARTDSGGSVGTVSTQSGYTIVANRTVTNVKAPTAVSYNPSGNFKNSLTVSWSGASAGTLNPITGYWVVPQFSTDNTNWSAGDIITVYTSETSGSTTIDTSGWEYGTYVYFKIRTLNTTPVNGYSYSDDVYSSSVIRKMPQTAPTPPSISLDKSENEVCATVKVSWGNGSAGTNNEITGYSLKIFRNNTYNSSYYSNVATNSFGVNTRFANVNITAYGRGYKYMFQIGVTAEDGQTYYSPLHTVAVISNQAPQIPTIVYPVVNNVTNYRSGPVAIKGGTDGNTDSQNYTLYFDNYTKKIAYRGTAYFSATSSGSHSYYMSDGLENSYTGFQNITILDAPWGNGVRLQGGDVIKAKHITDIQTCLTNLCKYYFYGTDEYTTYTTFTSVAAGATIKAAHFNELIRTTNYLLYIRGYNSTSYMNTVSKGDKIKVNDLNTIRNYIEYIF